MELIFNNLEVVWFILITVLFAGFFLLEGLTMVLVFCYHSLVKLTLTSTNDQCLRSCVGW